MAIITVILARRSTGAVTAYDVNEFFYVYVFVEREVDKG